MADSLYRLYSAERLRLIEHLVSEKGKSLDRAIHVAQEILDRIIFVTFCEHRGLLPARCVDRARAPLPALSKVTNPQWQELLDSLFAVDEGRLDCDLVARREGGLFAADPEVDDLDLDDDWTGFFSGVASYDFREEVSVDVLGRLFEKSVAELERIRLGGLSSARGVGGKSAERKRLGIYYTPPDFARFIAGNTVGRVVDLKLKEVGTSTEAARYWHHCLDALRGVKICDPACGGGVFLVQAYEVLEAHYAKIVDALALYEGPAADALRRAIPNMILNENLYGVDVSPEAVEITQLALWIRSARRGQTPADLSKNIVLGNSLVSDARVHPRAMVWETRFADVFSRADNPGFDCVIGNPPWERLKLQEREFFALSAPEIAGATSAAQRRKMIQALKASSPELYARYERARGLAEQTVAHVRTSGNFPRCAKGDVNAYALFAELARRIVTAHGRVGLLTPSGIATDKTTAEFFAELMETGSLIGLYDFENKAPVFPDAHRSFKFCVLVLGGSKVETAETDFVFFARRLGDLESEERHIPLSRADIALVNPNTQTCPVFRSRRDAELTKAVYRRMPILVDRSRKDDGNPWGIQFVTMFHQTNDAERFRTREELVRLGAEPRGNRWEKGGRTFLPLYEAKMLQAFDHRAAGVLVESANWVRQGQTDATSPAAHQDPRFVVQPRWWVEETEVGEVLGKRARPAHLCYRDVTSPTNRRTMIAAMLPRVAVVNSAPLILTGEDVGIDQVCCLLGNLNSLALDFIARQKVGGVHLNFFIVEQLPLFGPDRYDDRCPWDKSRTLKRWISDRVLRLTCTADDMRPLAEAARLDPPIHRWDPAEREKLRVELDAAFFLLYGIARDDVAYMLSTFHGAKHEERPPGDRLGNDASILDAYNELAQRG